ncbi:AGE family epimerase/isomerase, partial [Halobium palmae]
MVHSDRDPAVLRRRLFRVLDFYYPAILDDVFGGYVAQLDERTGHVYDGATKHLVATARAVHNFGLGARLDGPVWCRPAAERGVTFLNAVHWDDAREGFDWVLEGRTAVDRTRHCYGH